MSEARFLLSTFDIVALVWFFLVWILLVRIIDHRMFNLTSLNCRMHVIRRTWMRNMLARENRLPDVMLLGHLIHSASFFASTTVLLLAGLIGALTAGTDLLAAVTELGTPADERRLLLNTKVLLIVGVLIFAFFSFAWAIRQFNYTVALIGGTPIDSARGAATVEASAEVLTLAVRSFNGGLRCYYLSFAALGWFVGPLVFMSMVGCVGLLLMYQQFGSPAHRAVARYEAGLPPL